MNCEELKEFIITKLTELLIKTDIEDKQIEINKSLQTEYNELKQNYDTLEIQYKRDLESCYVQLEVCK